MNRRRGSGVDRVFNVSWALADPAIAAITPEGLRADFRPAAIGVTTADVTAVAPSGQVVSSGRVEVRVVPTTAANRPTVLDGPPPP